MKNILIPTLISATFLAPVNALEYYIVQPGDILSKVLLEKFPGERVYGRKGKINKVIKQNPEIKDPNFIKPNQTIVLESANNLSLPETLKNEEIAKEEPAVEVAENNIFISEEKLPAEAQLLNWKTGIHYGYKHLSVNQTGALGTAKFGVSFFNDIKVRSELQKDDLGLWLQFERYAFKYRYANSLTENKFSLNSFDLGTSYKMMFLGASYEQRPVFRKIPSDLESTILSNLSVNIGLKKDFSLSESKTTKLSLLGWASLPVTGSVEKSGVSVSSTKGFGLKAQAGLTHEIFRRPTYAIDLSWLNDFRYTRQSQNINWSSTSGKVESQYSEVSSTLGVGFNF